MYKELWKKRKTEMSGIITELWEHPELPMMEYESVEILTRWLENNEFQVERKFCNMQTAFRATYGNGKPVIGILAEYDAMDGLDNQAVPYRQSVNKRAGHACLHCHIGGGNTGAAIAVKDYLKESKKSGTVVVIGTPAEELLYGKVALMGEGGFDGLDILLTSHVDYQNCAASRPTLSCFATEFCFGGISSHSGASRSHNALDGAELAVEMIERMRCHQFPTTSVEHVIRNGGKMPNITPDRATLWVNIRDVKYEKAKEVYEYVCSIVKEAAMIAGVNFTEGFLAGCRGYLPNDTLGKLLYKQLQEIGVHTYTEEEIKWMEELTKNATGVNKVVSKPDLCYLSEGVDPYSQDDGEVSWHVPLGRVNWEIPLQIPLHNWCTTAIAGTVLTKHGAFMASEAIFRATLEIFEDPSIVQDAERERKERIGDNIISGPVYGSFKDLTTNPSAFWDGTWLNNRV